MQEKKILKSIANLKTPYSHNKAYAFRLAKREKKAHQIYPFCGPCFSIMEEALAEEEFCRSLQSVRERKREKRSLRIKPFSPGPERKFKSVISGETQVCSEMRRRNALTAAAAQ
ncbi:hypothetical protein CDAR_9771 [Caerostris darwini]|uniref:Uncharacterized protein n=1 Tax=Caerostris darwini TaxID=1538125 RepID=A0AAV4URL4_9ARAC|nr:hypothetical protein CDAR_9771 [Caerostris darwini]